MDKPKLQTRIIVKLDTQNPESVTIPPPLLKASQDLFEGSDAALIVEELVETPLEFASLMLLKHGNFFPFANGVSAQGEPLSIQLGREDEQMTPEAAYEVARANLGSPSLDLVMCVVAADVRVTQGNMKRDAIRLDLELSNGIAATLVFPYSLTDTQLEIDEPIGLAAEPRFLHGGTNSQSKISAAVELAIKKTIDLVAALTQAQRDDNQPQVVRIEKELARVHEALSPSDREAYFQELRGGNERLKALAEPYLVVLRLDTKGVLSHQDSRTDLIKLESLLAAEKVSNPGLQVVIATDKTPPAVATTHLGDIKRVTRKLGLADPLVVNDEADGTPTGK